MDNAPSAPEHALVVTPSQGADRPLIPSEERNDNGRAFEIIVSTADSDSPQRRGSAPDTRWDRPAPTSARTESACGSELSLRVRYGVDMMEDLTERLIHAGHYEEYVRWRDGYARWRMGHSRGARGELGSIARPDEESQMIGLTWNLEANTDAFFRNIYPTFRSFMFKRTLAYWAAVSFIEGSALFSIAFIASVIQGPSNSHLSHCLTDTPSVVGGIWFFFGSYLGYVQQLNWELGPKSPTASWYFVVPWKLPTTYGMVGWQAYLYGCGFFTIAQWMTFISWGSILAKQCAIYTPMAAGGVAFIVAGVCEVRENADERWTLVWYASWANLIGSVMFFVGAVVPMWDPESAQLLVYGCSLPFGIGSVIFFGASTASLVLWKNDMFGLTLSRRLNTVSAQHCRPLSGNTLAVNIVYIMCATVCSVNFLFAMASNAHLKIPDRVSHIVNASLLFLLVHLLLVLTSVITILPKEQPYRALMLTIRFLSVYMLAGSVSTFVWLVQSGNGPATDNPDATPAPIPVTQFPRIL